MFCLHVLWIRFLLTFFVIHIVFKSIHAVVACFALRVGLSFVRGFSFCSNQEPLVLLNDRTP